MNETINWIMSVLYQDCNLTDAQYQELLADVTALVTKWENILMEDK